MNHSFDIENAKKYGVTEAIVLENIMHWLRVNKANRKNIIDGKVWTYNSIRAYSELFPYLTEKQIRRAIQSLSEQGAIVKGEYNKAKYDKTAWYSIPDESDLAICPEGQMDSPEKANRIAQEGEPIPDINTDTKPTKKDADKSAPYYKETCEIFDKGFEKMESAKYAWSAKDGKAVKEIIGKAIRSTGVDQVCMEIILEIKKRAAALYRDIEGNRQAKLRGGKHNDFMARKKFTPQNLNSMWNDYPTAKAPQTAIEIIGSPDIPDDELKRHREAAGWS